MFGRALGLAALLLLAVALLVLWCNGAAGELGVLRVHRAGTCALAQVIPVPDADGDGVGDYLIGNGCGAEAANGSVTIHSGGTGAALAAIEAGSLGRFSFRGGLVAAPGSEGGAFGVLAMGGAIVLRAQNDEVVIFDEVRSSALHSVPTAAVGLLAGREHLALGAPLDRKVVLIPLDGFAREVVVFDERPGFGAHLAALADHRDGQSSIVASWGDTQFGFGLSCYGVDGVERWSGPVASRAITQLENVGDIDRDGYDDLAAGVPYAGGEGRELSGVIRIFSGRSGEPVFEITTDDRGTQIGKWIRFSPPGYLWVQLEQSGGGCSPGNRQLLRVRLRTAECWAVMVGRGSAAGLTPDIDLDGLPEVALLEQLEGDESFRTSVLLVSSQQLKLLAPEESPLRFVGPHY